jgi:GR25 family glycosyltransferase involved in LPS biosynthesis
MKHTLLILFVFLIGVYAQIHDILVRDILVRVRPVYITSNPQPLRLLKHVFYINLSHRTDRNQHFIEEMKQLNDLIEYYNLGSPIHPERIEAVNNPSNGAIGCTMSHIRCIELAKQRNLPYVCIFEDDVMFTQPKLFLTRLKRFEEEFDAKWDVLLLGAHITRRKWYREQSYCQQVYNASTTTAYIVQQHYYDTLLENFKSGLHLFQTTGDKRKYPIDIYWKRLQTRDRWYALTPITITQYDNYSDIRGSTSKLRPLFLMLGISSEWLN